MLSAEPCKRIRAHHVSMKMVERDILSEYVDLKVAVTSTMVDKTKNYQLHKVEGCDNQEVLPSTSYHSVGSTRTQQCVGEIRNQLSDRV